MTQRNVIFLAENSGERERTVRWTLLKKFAANVGKNLREIYPVTLNL